MSEPTWDARSFYEFQERLSGAYTGMVTAQHRTKAGLVQAHCGRNRHVLELGAGGGQMAVATAELGFAVDAIELVPRLAAHARELAANSGVDRVTVIEGDFYETAVDGPYGAVMYWDGFGVGSDSDQQALLRRIHDWLDDDGRALIDIYTPWYWSRVAGQEMAFEKSHRRYDFDANSGTLIDTWWPDGAVHESASQHLRCYAPQELKALLRTAELSLQAALPGGVVPLQEAMSYTAVIARNGS